MSVLIGFEGSRSLPESFRPLVHDLIACVTKTYGYSIATGCAGGLDAFVRAACPDAIVFRAADFGSGRASFARRSIALVKAIANSGGRGMVVFPNRPCPSGLLPSYAACHCFCGLGSGSWASAALAAGLGMPVWVFGLPRSALPDSWGGWEPGEWREWRKGFLLTPRQPGLFRFE